MGLRSRGSLHVYKRALSPLWRSGNGDLLPISFRHNGVMREFTCCNSTVHSLSQRVGSDLLSRDVLYLSSIQFAEDTNVNFVRKCRTTPLLQKLSTSVLIFGLPSVQRKLTGSFPGVRSLSQGGIISSTFVFGLEVHHRRTIFHNIGDETSPRPNGTATE